MYIDKKLTFHDKLITLAQGANACEFDVDLGEGKYLLDTPLSVLMKIGTAVTSAGAATVKFVLTTDTDSAFGSAKTLFDSGALAKTVLTADAEVCDFQLPSHRSLEDVTDGTERYLRITITVATADLTAGTFRAYVYPTGAHQTNKNSWIT